MSGDLAIDDALVALAQDVYRFVTSVERPRVADAAWMRKARQRCTELREQVTRMYADLETRGRSAGAQLDRMSAGLREYRRVLAERPSVARMRQAARRLAEDYEDLVAALRSHRASRAPAARVLKHIRPVTWSRGIFHAVWGVGAVLLYHFVLSWGQAMVIMASVAGLAATLETTRRIWPRWNAFLLEKVFGKVARPWERHRVNSATWYVAALTVLTALLPKAATEVGVLVLAFGDPAAALVGTRWGRVKLYRRKSWAGTGAFLVVGFAAAAGFLALTGAAPAGTLLALAATAAAAGAMAELFTDRLDDNFTVPVLAAGVAALWLIWG